MVCGLSRLSSMEGEFFGFRGWVFIPATSVPLPSLGTLAVLNPCRRGKMQPPPLSRANQHMGILFPGKTVLAS